MQFKIITSIVLIIVLESRKTDCFICYQCASKGLEKSWAMTGLQLPPVSIVTLGNFFTDECDTKGGANPSEDNTCGDFCFTMYITSLDLTGKAGPQYVVRGCHEDFTNFTYPGNTTQVEGGTSGLCQYGIIRRYTSSTNAPAFVDTEAAYGWCNTDVTKPTITPCNSQNIRTFQSVTCQQPPKVNCYDCVQSSYVSCSTTNDNGSYCYTSDLFVNGERFLTRSISDINPLFPYTNTTVADDMQPQEEQGKCGTVKLTYPVGSVSITVQGQECYCNDVNLCNIGDYQIGTTTVAQTITTTGVGVQITFSFLVLSTASVCCVFAQIKCRFT